MRRQSLFVILFLLLVRPAWALDVPASPSSYVNDYAGLLSPAVRRQLEEKLAEFERGTSNQVLVATFPDLQGEPIEDFSIRLAEKWKPGQAERDNGVILIVAKGDRVARIEVGYGLEGGLPDAVTKSILENEILPAFKRGDYDAGIQAGIDAILRATRGEYQAGPSRGGPNPKLILLILFALLLYFFFVRWLGRGQRIGRGGSSRDIFWGGGPRSGGWGGGSWGGGGSGGGYSSGGGSFGGGGASGRW